MSPCLSPLRPRQRLLAALATPLLLVAACGSDTAGTDGDPVVVATTSIWADVVSNVTCEGQTVVETLIPAGSDPHAFEPSLADRGDIEAAELVIANGLDLEEGLADVLDAVDTPVVAMTDLLAILGEDPHVWFDPGRVAAALPALADAVTAATDLDADAVAGCTAEYMAELERLDAEIADLVGAVAPTDRTLVTNHASLGYFADRYGFDVVGTVIPAASGLAETNPAQLAALADVIEREGVPAIFVEDQRSTDDAEALADQIGGVEIVTLFTGSLGPPGSGADTYAGFLRTNAEKIVGALG